jgi:hypothetical protein
MMVERFRGRIIYQVINASGTASLMRTVNITTTQLSFQHLEPLFSNLCKYNPITLYTEGSNNDEDSIKLTTQTTQAMTHAIPPCIVRLLMATKLVICIKLCACVCCLIVVVYRANSHLKHMGRLPLCGLSQEDEMCLHKSAWNQIDKHTNKHRQTHTQRDRNTPTLTQ